MTCPKCQLKMEAREFEGGAAMICPTLHYSFVPPRNVVLTEANASFLTARTAELQLHTYEGSKTI